jgi:hypothetical protein
MIAQLRSIQASIKSLGGRLLVFLVGTFPIVFGLNPLVIRSMDRDQAVSILRYRGYTLLVLLASYAIFFWGVVFVDKLSFSQVLVGAGIILVGVVLYAFEWVLWHHDSPLLSMSLDDLAHWNPSPVRNLIFFLLIGLTSSLIIAVLSRNGPSDEKSVSSLFSAERVSKQLDNELSASKSKLDQEISLFEQDLIHLESVSKQTKEQITERSLALTKRKALVVTFSEYKQANPLKGVRVVASVMNQALSRAGFDILHLDNVDQREFEQGVQTYINNLSQNDISFVYIAGHGMQIDGQNHLLHLDFPVDRYYTVIESPMKSAQLISSFSVDLNHLIDRLTSSKDVRFSFFVIDACRDVAGRIKGLAEFTTSRMNLAVLAAASPGQAAIDRLDEIGGGGPLAYGIAKHLVRGVDQVELSLSVKAEVAKLLKDYPPYVNGKCVKLEGKDCANIPVVYDPGIRRFQLGLPVLSVDKKVTPQPSAQLVKRSASDLAVPTQRDLASESVAKICRGVVPEDCYAALKSWSNRAYSNRIEWSDRVKSAAYDLEQSFVASNSSLSYQMKYWQRNRWVILVWLLVWGCLFSSYVLIQRHFRIPILAYKFECHKTNRWQIKHTHHLVDDWINSASTPGGNGFVTPIVFLEKNWDEAKDFYPESDRVPDRVGDQVFRGEVGHIEFENQLRLVS